MLDTSLSAGRGFRNVEDVETSITRDVIFREEVKEMESGIE